MDRACSTHGKEECYLQGLVEKLKERELGRPRHKWDDNIKWILEE
jgi:hypothetical protein